MPPTTPIEVWSQGVEEVPGVTRLAGFAVSLVLAAFATGVATGSAPRVYPRFGGSEAYPVGGVLAVAIGDLNGDGRQDVAVADDGRNAATVLLNAGGGRFRRPRSYGAGHVPYGIAIGDLNGDGHADLVVVNYGNTASVLLNTGNGTFEPSVEYPSGENPWGVAISDLNGDGKPDLAIADAAPDTVSVLLNNGDGTFRSGVAYGTGAGPISIVAVDLNGDGKPDLATANVLTDTVSVLLGNGDGTFQPRRDLAAGDAPYSLAAGDVNGDGRPDLATADYGDFEGGGGGNTASVLLNRGGGSFSAPVEYPTDLNPVGVALADVNGDGPLDLVVADDGGTITTRLNAGDGTFKARRDDLTGSAPRTLAVGDLNGDGKPDLVSNLNNIVLVWLNATGRCRVPPVRRWRLAAAEREIRASGCSVGRVRSRASRTIAAGRVVSVRPDGGIVLALRAPVAVVISRGRR
jgi:hypothetical protein